MVNVDLSGGNNVSAVPLQVSYDKRGLEMVNISVMVIFSPKENRLWRWSIAMIPCPTRWK